LFLIKKLVTPFLLPPGLFVAVLVLSGMWLIVRRRAKSGLSLTGLGLFMWCLCITPVSDLLIRPLVLSYPVPTKPSGDVIILLCGGANLGVKDLTGTGTPSASTLARMTDAVRLHRKLGIPIVVSGGRVFDQEQSEASIVKRFLVDVGIDPSMVLTEEESRDTLENARYSEKLCRLKGYTRPILVTSAYHLKRAVWSFKSVGLKVVPFPTGGSLEAGKKYIWPDYLPGSFRRFSAALHEILGLAYYRIIHTG